MGQRFAAGHNALAICDVCGFQYRLGELRSLVVRGVTTQVKACPECWNPDQPQNKLGEFPVDDPQALRNPRPDFAELAASRAHIEPIDPSIVVGFGKVGVVNISGIVTNTFTVTVATGTNSYGTGNKFYLGGVVSPTIDLTEGLTYKFDQSDGTNGTHPLRLSTTPNGTWGGGSEYTTGVTKVGVPGNAGAYTQITVPDPAPTLYYYCSAHSGMGGQANTP
tara:strand:- start:18035 stop:18697 length:663 start_codon:yes stop_codon:yes gene_type:complete